MNKSIKLLASASALVAFAVATPAFAAGTASGTDIKNTASIKFKVGGVDQKEEDSNEDSFKVDRKVNFTVTETNNATTIVTPGADYQVTTFDVENLSNAALTIKLAATNLAGDQYDVSTIRYIMSTVTAGGLTGTFDAQGVFTPGTGETELTSTDPRVADLAADGKVRIFVIANVPVLDAAGDNLDNGDLGNIRLTGTAWSAATAGSALVTSPTSTKNVVDIVLAETNNNPDGDATNYDGVQSDIDGYEVETADITLRKNSYVISDPITTAIGSGVPKLIPGAVVEYCLIVKNATAVSASGIELTDVTPPNTTFVLGSIIKDMDVDTTAETCTDGTGTAVTDAAGYTASTKTIQAILTSELATGGSAGTSPAKGLRFRVTINTTP
jgi:uncharacterized repeat protein (TIGR01451 family)